MTRANAYVGKQGKGCTSDGEPAVLRLVGADGGFPREPVFCPIRSLSPSAVRLWSPHVDFTPGGLHTG
jgi:hypothetical protein